MLWFKKKKRPPEELTVPEVSFVGEQDGAPERDFKSAVIPILNERPHVLSAFLARVDYGTPQEFNVALCIRSEQLDDVQMKEDIGRVFSGQFGTHEHLDIIFLRPEQEAELRRVCRSFHEKTRRTE